MPGAPVPVLTVKLEFPEPLLIEFWLKLAVTPAGKPLTLRLTVELKPSTEFTTT